MPITVETRNSLQREMRVLAQETVLRCFSDLFRLRVVAQSEVQRTTTLLLMHSCLADTLKVHETQINHGPSTELSSLRAALFLTAFGEIAGTMMEVVGSGLTAAESEVLRGEEQDCKGLPVAPH